MESVATKTDFYRRWMCGEFGNRPQAWNSLSSLRNSRYRGLVNIRHAIPGSQATRFNVPKSECGAVIASSGFPVSEFRFNEPMPDDKLVMQGELIEDFAGWHLKYSREKCSMREAMKAASFADGLQAKMLLKSACNPASFADLEVLVDRYEGHAIEFGCYAIPVGDIPHRNTIIWEVRRY